LSAAEIAWQIGNASISVLLHDEVTAPLAAAAAVQGVQLASIEAVGSLDAVGAPVPPPARVALDAVHSVMYTSGTSGRPKSAMLTHGNLWWSAVGSALHLGHRPDDRWLAVLPLFHIGGLSILLRGVIGAVPVVLHEAFDPERVNWSIDHEGITLLSVVPTMLQRVLEARGARPFPAALRCVLLGGGPAPASLIEESLARGLPVAPTYGLTEAASQVTTLLPDQVRQKLGSSGLPLPVTEIRIESEGRPAPPGTHGEIAVRGPTVSPGYLGHEARSGPERQDGWLRTGDLGWMDEDGYLYVLSRRDDLIISGGENIYPAEVEAVLAMHPAVVGAAVVGEPDALWGEVPVAFVELRPGEHVAEDEIRAFCASRLARYKCPRRIVWVESLPRNAAGKVMRRELRRHNEGMAL
jgi:O-succinylbenzoic acid--CoA ligase